MSVEVFLRFLSWVIFYFIQTFRSFSVSVQLEADIFFCLRYFYIILQQYLGSVIK